MAGAYKHDKASSVRFRRSASLEPLDWIFSTMGRRPLRTDLGQFGTTTYSILDSGSAGTFTVGKRETLKLQCSGRHSSDRTTKASLTSGGAWSSVSRARHFLTLSLSGVVSSKVGPALLGEEAACRGGVTNVASAAEGRAMSSQQGRRRPQRCSCAKLRTLRQTVLWKCAWCLRMTGNLT